MKVEKEHTNQQGTLHGGFITLLVDYTTLVTAAVATGKHGVSIQLNTRYVYL